MELYAVKTWYDQRQGVVTVEDDVLGVIRDIHALDPRIHVYHNEQTGHFDLVEHCLDGVERLIFSVVELDPRVVTRLRAGDSWLSGNPNHPVDEQDDFLTQMEADQERLQAEAEEAARDKIRDAGERLAWALDLVEDRPSAGGSILVPKGVDHG